MSLKVTVQVRLVVNGPIKLADKGLLLEAADRLEQDSVWGAVLSPEDQEMVDALRRVAEALDVEVIRTVG